MNAWGGINYCLINILHYCHSVKRKKMERGKKTKCAQFFSILATDNIPQTLFYCAQGDGNILAKLSACIFYLPGTNLTLSGETLIITGHQKHLGKLRKSHILQCKNKIK